MFGARKKRRHAFEGEVLPHLDALYAMGVRVTRNEADAHDLVQESVLKAFRSWDTFQVGTNCKAWLFRILMNTFINKYRRRELERSLLERGETDPGILSDWTATGPPDPEARLISQAVVDDVHRALEALPVDYRTAVMLADLEGFSYKEIAEICECPIGTVMSRLHRGRRAMQQLLERAAVEHGIAPAADRMDARPGGEGASSRSNVIPLRSR